jgi:hypothetical protein
MAAHQRTPIWRKSHRPAWAWKVFLVAILTAIFAVLLREIPKMPRTLSVFRSVFDFTPGIAGYFVAAGGVALLFMTDDLKRLEKYRKTRLGIAAIVFMLGLGAVVSDNAQKLDERKAAKAERDESDGDRHALTKQVTELITQQAVLQAEVKSFSDRNLPHSLGGHTRGGEPHAPPPDLHLKLVYPGSVAVMIYNEVKAGVAYKPKYQITLADLDNLDGNLLKIPTQEGDFIRPGEAWDLIAPWIFLLSRKSRKTATISSATRLCCVQIV